MTAFSKPRLADPGTGELKCDQSGRKGGVAGRSGEGITNPIPRARVDDVLHLGASVPPAIKAAILKAIPDHIRAHGRRHWDLLREREDFAAWIGRASGVAGKRRFWRWVRAVSQPPPPDRTRPFETRSAATEALNAAADQARLAAEKNLPAAPSPSYLMRTGVQGVKSLDFLAAVSGIWADAELLRELAMTTDGGTDGARRIANAAVFDSSIRRRLEVVESALRIMREIWDLKYQQSFYDAITNIIVDELASVPEIQMRVCQKLTELNNNIGMTIHMESR